MYSSTLKVANDPDLDREFGTDLAGPMQEHLDDSAGVLLGFATTTDLNQIPEQYDVLQMAEVRDELRYDWMPFTDTERNS